MIVRMQVILGGVQMWTGELDLASGNLAETGCRPPNLDVIGALAQLAKAHSEFAGQNFTELFSASLDSPAKMGVVADIHERLIARLEIRKLLVVEVDAGGIDSEGQYLKTRDGFFTVYKTYPMPDAETLGRAALEGFYSETGISVVEILGNPRLGAIGNAILAAIAGPKGD